MLLKLLRYVIGYLKVEVRGFAPERLMNLIIENDIVVWDVEVAKGGYIFYTGRKNLMKMKPLLQRTNVKMHILSKHGLPYVIKRNQKRAFFVAGFFACGFVVYVLSLFIWEVKLCGEETLISNNMLKEIEREFVPLGTRKSAIDCNDLERRLRSRYDEIAWISCDIRGTTLTISLEEGIKPQETTRKIKSGDLVATKDATITKMITREGTPVSKVKDSVKKGDVLISGTIYIYDDFNEIMETDYLVADGDIYGTVKETYEDSVKMQYYSKVYEEHEKKYYTFFLFDYCFTPYVPKSFGDTCDSSTQIKKAKLFSDFYLPMGVKKTVLKRYRLKQETYTRQEAEAILKRRLEEKIKSFEEKGVEIIKNNVKIVDVKEEGVMRATGTLILNEKIAGLKELNPISRTDEER